LLALSSGFVTFLDEHIGRPAFSRSALVLSIVLHILLVYGLLHEELLWAEWKAAETPQVSVELVPELPKPRPPNPPPPKVEEPKPEPPKPPQPQPDTVEAPKPPPPLTVPQLTPGRVAQQSAVPHPSPRNGAAGEDRAVAMETGPSFSLLPKEQTKAERPGSKGPQGPELTQSEQDFVLAQVMKYWHVNLHAPEAHGLVLEGVFLLQADGTLASPFNKNDPWNPAAVVRGYESLGRPGISFRRDSMDAFLLALRLCQPLQLPSTKGPWPRKVTIRFAFDSL
jgi:hypothetical protein